MDTKLKKSSGSKIEFSKSKENNLSSLPTRFSLFPERKKKETQNLQQSFFTNFDQFSRENSKCFNFLAFLKFKIFCEIARTVFENYSKCRT